MSLIAIHEPAIGQEEILTIRVTGSQDIELFKKMVNRAANTWDTAPAHLKSFFDIITEGSPLQDYEGLGSEVKAT
jgi:hypothetical protein